MDRFAELAYSAYSFRREQSNRLEEEYATHRWASLHELLYQVWATVVSWLGHSGKNTSASTFWLRYIRPKGTKNKEKLRYIRVKYRNELGVKDSWRRPWYTMRIVNSNNKSVWQVKTNNKGNYIEFKRTHTLYALSRHKFQSTATYSDNAQCSCWRSALRSSLSNPARAVS